MSDINTQQFTTRNSVSLITLPGTHRSGNILDKFIDLLVGNKQASLNYEFPSGHFRAENRIDDKNTERRNTILLTFTNHFFSSANLNYYPTFILFQAADYLPTRTTRKVQRQGTSRRLSTTFSHAAISEENNYYSFACSTLMTLYFLRAPRTEGGGGERSFPKAKFRAQENRLNNAAPSSRNLRFYLANYERIVSLF